METLLHKVQTVEQEAEQIVESAKQAGMDSLQQLLGNEQAMLAETREKAEVRANRIVQERVQKADEEINAIKQQSEKSIEVVRSAAKKNRGDVIKLATQLFTDEYL